jgi:hypothetical protein
MTTRGGHQRHRRLDAVVVEAVLGWVTLLLWLVFLYAAATAH